MLKGAVARRYAQAVFSIALERDELDRWLADLEDIAALFAQAELAPILESRKVPSQEKQRLLIAGLPDVSAPARNLAQLLVTRNRMGIIAEIIQEYQRLLNAHRGIAEAQVITAIPLEAKEEEDLARSLGQILQKKMLLTTMVDPAILGGLIARIGDRVVDGSTRRKLEELRKSLVGEVR